MNNILQAFDPISILIGIGLIIIIFLIAREVVCWYWKINRIEKLLEDIRDNTSTKSQKNDTESPIDSQKKT